MARFIEFVKRLLSRSSMTEDRLVESFDKNVPFGSIACPSGRISFADPQYVHEPSTCVIQLTPGDICFFGDVLRWSKESGRVYSLTARLSETPEPAVWEDAGSFSIDSAKVVVADSDQLRDCWSYDGPDRIGFVVDVDALCRALRTEFRLSVVSDEDEGKMRIVEPVTEELEARIRKYLAASPRYSRYPEWSIFNVKTNNSSDRVNKLQRSWRILPIGNDPSPQMLACDTGWGDGSYEVLRGMVGETPTAAKVVFIEDDEGHFG